MGKRLTVCERMEAEAQKKAKLKKNKVIENPTSIDARDTVPEVAKLTSNIGRVVVAGLQSAPRMDDSSLSRHQDKDQDEQKAANQDKTRQSRTESASQRVLTRGKAPQEIMR